MLQDRANEQTSVLFFVRPSRKVTALRDGYQNSPAIVGEAAARVLRLDRTDWRHGSLPPPPTDRNDGAEVSLWRIAAVGPLLCERTYAFPIRPLLRS